MTFQAAFYHGRPEGWKAIYSTGVHWWTKSPYSHCELVFSDGLWGSSSFLDGGVRLKRISPNPDHWDFLTVDSSYETYARRFVEDRIGMKYDILGNVGFVLGPVYDSKNRMFCSELVMAALGSESPRFYHPGLAYDAVKLLTSRP
jgi:hypothetical protein